MSLLFNMLSRFVIAFLPRSKCLLISWLQSPSIVIMETKKINSVTFPFSPYLLLLFSRQVVSNSSLPLGLHHAWLLCHSPSPRVFAQVHVHCIGDAIQPSNPLLPSSPSAVNLSQHQCCFLVSWPFTSGGQSIGASVSVLLMSFQSWVPLRFTGLISLLAKGLSWVFSSTTVQKHQFFGFLPSLWFASHNHMTTGSTITQTIWNFVRKWCLWSRFVVAFLPRSNCLLISWLQSQSRVILEPKKRKSVTGSIFPLLFAKKWWAQMPWS